MKYKRLAHNDGQIMEEDVSDNWVTIQFCLHLYPLQPSKTCKECTRDRKSGAAYTSVKRQLCIAYGCVHVTAPYPQVGSVSVFIWTRLTSTERWCSWEQSIGFRDRNRTALQIWHWSHKAREVWHKVEVNRYNSQLSLLQKKRKLYITTTVKSICFTNNSSLVFRPSATVSRDGLMEWCTFCRCPLSHNHPPVADPPPHQHHPLAFHVMDDWGARPLRLFQRKKAVWSAHSQNMLLVLSLTWLDKLRENIRTTALNSKDRRLCLNIWRYKCWPSVTKRIQKQRKVATEMSILVHCGHNSVQICSEPAAFGYANLFPNLCIVVQCVVSFAFPRPRKFLFLLFAPVLLKACK